MQPGSSGKWKVVGDTPAATPAAPETTAGKADAAGAVKVGKFNLPAQYAGLGGNDDVFAQVPQDDLLLLDGSAWKVGDQVELPNGDVGEITGLASQNPSALKHYGLIKVNVNGKVSKRSVTSLRPAKGAGTPEAAPEAPTPDVTPEAPPAPTPDVTPEAPPAPAPDVTPPTPEPPTPPTPKAATFPDGKRIEAGQVLSPDNEVLTLDGAIAEVGLPVKSYKDGGIDGMIEALDPNDELVAWVRLSDGRLVGRPRNSLKFFAPETVPEAAPDVGNPPVV